MNITRGKKRESKSWPKSWRVPKGASAMIWYEDGAISAKIPKQSEYAPESPGMMACLAMIVSSKKMRAWRTRFIARQFRLAKEAKP